MQGSSYFFFFILFLINNLLHRVSEKVVIILFIVLIFFIYSFFIKLLSNSYYLRINKLVKEIHFYIDSLFTLLYLFRYYMLRISLLVKETNLLLQKLATSFLKLSSLKISYSRSLKPLLTISFFNSPDMDYCIWLNEYWWVCIFIFSAFVIASLLVFLSYVLVYQESDIEKSSAYECGFQPFGDTRNKFNVKYYLVAILFMIFDLEIMYLFPWAISVSITGLFGLVTIIIFLSLLIIGFIYEWQKGALDWN